MVEWTSDVVKVAKDERLFQPESTSDDIPSVLEGKATRVLDGQCALEQELLIVGQLNDERDVKDILQPFRKQERDQMAQMHRLCTRTSTGVEVEGLALLVAGQDGIQISMREEAAAAQKRVRLVARDLFKPLQELLGDVAGSKLLDELVVVDCGDGPIFLGSSLDVPRCDFLLG